MKYIYIASMLLLSSMWSCKSTKQIQKVIEPKDTAHVVVNNSELNDSVLFVRNTLDNLQQNFIDFKTFSAKIKVDVEDAKGKQPDITATVRMIKDSTIWISLNATFLNIEVYRILITKDSVILMNKQDKEVQYRTIDYLQDVTQIPFDFTTLQNIFLGNVVFFEPSNAVFKKTGDYIFISSITNEFKNLLTLTADKNLILQTKLDDVNFSRNRTANITYEDYEGLENKFFSTKREIAISEKSKIDIKLKFKQFEFNKELSVAFPVPKNYKRK
jgi:hypothetical protein